MLDVTEVTILTILRITKHSLICLLLWDLAPASADTHQPFNSPPNVTYSSALYISTSENPRRSGTCVISCYFMFPCFCLKSSSCGRTARRSLAFLWLTLFPVPKVSTVFPFLLTVLGMFPVSQQSFGFLNPQLKLNEAVRSAYPTCKIVTDWPAGKWKCAL